MIKVTYNREYNRLTVTGHAQSAPKGEDLVCSAASILVHTLEADVQHLQMEKAVNQVNIDVQDGHAEISCTANHKFRSVVANVFASVCVGFEILASKFPEYISYEIMG